jgi:DNA-binding CsgD family transcriptional regulator
MSELVFPSLTALQRKRLAERGIDLEESYRRFIAEIREDGPPPRLLHLLARPRRGAKGFLTANDYAQLVMVAQGFSDKQVAELLYMSVYTVRDYRKKLRILFGARTLAQVIARAYETHILVPESQKGPKND